MKKIILIVLVSAFTISICHGQMNAYYYKAGGEIQNIVINNNRALVYFDKDLIKYVILQPENQWFEKNLQGCVPFCQKVGYRYM